MTPRKSDLDPTGCFFTEHYRNYLAVLIRLAEVPKPLLVDVVKEKTQVAIRAATRR